MVELPVIAIDQPLDGGAALAAAADRLTAGLYAWVACTSANAASRIVEALGDRAVPHSVRWAAVGTGTAAVLQEAGFPPELVPERSVSDGLAEEFPDADGNGIVLFPRAEKVRGALADGLLAKGWEVDEVVAYRTVSGSPDQIQVAAARQADAIVFTSSSTVERTIELLGVTGIPPVVVSIGPVTSGTARALGLQVAAEAEQPTMAGLADAVVDAFTEVRNRRRRQQQQQQQ
jgi:uroporphyrinogen-III synthase